MEYASRGVANAGLATGIIGTTLGALSGGVGMLGGWGRNGGYGCGGFGYGMYPYELDRRIDDVERMADKDMAIAELQAEKVSNEHDIELYKQFRVDLNSALEPIKSDIRELQRFERDQAVYNGVNTATQTLIRSQVDELLALTKRIIPNASVVPGWGEVEITPVAPTAAG